MMVTSPMDALSFSLCFDTASLAHCDAVRGERHPPHLLVTFLIPVSAIALGVLVLGEHLSGTETRAWCSLGQGFSQSMAEY